MKNNFKFYFFLWVILLAVFNAVVFLVRSVVPEYTIVYDARFWIAWSLIVVAFCGNLICSYFAFKAENAKRMFYNLPLITISWSALIAMLMFGCLVMLIPDCPAWVASIVCILVLAFNVIAVIKAKWASEIVSVTDEKINKSTSFIYDMHSASESLLLRAKTEEIKAVCIKIRDAFKYSDPMSTDMLNEIEDEIKSHFDLLKQAVTQSDAEVVTDESNEIFALIAERNNKCKRSK